MRLAMAYREQWGRDVVIDLIGYRRYGHNETDEPAYTQPRMAAQIKAHQPVSELYAEQLVAEGVVSADEVAAEAQGAARAAAGDAQASCGRRWRRASTRTRARPRSGPASSTGPRAPRSRPRSPRSGCARSTRSCSRSRTASRSTASSASRCCGGSRSSTTGEIEFGHAEALAFASLLTEGTHIRLTGQDTERGTFSHRHLALHDEKTGLQVRADPEPLRGAGAVRAPQQPALGGRLPGVRVRLLGRLARSR